MELTAERIERTKQIMSYSPKHGAPLHEHDDCIRIAYQWLDAQIKVKRIGGFEPWKHIIEKWGERYVSQSDVEVAAEMHPDVAGVYPRFNISARLVLPSRHRLIGVGEAGKHKRYGEWNSGLSYYWLEAEDGSLTKKPVARRFG